MNGERQSSFLIHQHQGADLHPQRAQCEIMQPILRREATTRTIVSNPPHIVPPLNRRATAEGAGAATAAAATAPSKAGKPASPTLGSIRVLKKPNATYRAVRSMARMRTQGQHHIRTPNKLLKLRKPEPRAGKNMPAAPPAKPSHVQQPNEIDDSPEEIRHNGSSEP